MALTIAGREPDPDAAVAHVQHAEHADDEEQAAQIHHVLARRTRHLEHAGLHLLEVLQHEDHGHGVELRVAEREHGLCHEGLCLLAGLQRCLAGLDPHDLGHLEQHAIENAHQHLARAFTLGRGHIAFHEIGDGLQPAQRLAIGTLLVGLSREQLQRLGGRLRQRTAQLGARGIDGLGHIGPGRLLAQFGILQRAAQAQEGVHFAFGVGGNAQIAHGVGLVVAHAQQEHALAVARVHGQHVVLELARLARGIAQLVADAGADVAQLLLGHGLVGRAQALVDGLLQVHLAHIGGAATGAARTAEVLDVDGAQLGKLQRQRLVLAVGELARELAGAANHAFDIEGRGPGLQRHGMQLHRRAAVIKAGLVDLDAAVAGRVVDLDALFQLLARGLVVDDDLAGKQLGHARGVVLDDELLELHRKGQLLQQHAIGLRQDGRARRAALGHQQVAAEGGVAFAQPVLLGHLGDQATAGIRCFASQPHLRTHDKVTVEQPPRQISTMAPWAAM